MKPYGKFTNATYKLPFIYDLPILKHNIQVHAHVLKVVTKAVCHPHVIRNLLLCSLV